MSYDIRQQIAEAREGLERRRKAAGDAAVVDGCKRLIGQAEDRLRSLELVVANGGGTSEGLAMQADDCMREVGRLLALIDDQLASSSSLDLLRLLAFVIAISAVLAGLYSAVVFFADDVTIIDAIFACWLLALAVIAGKAAAWVWAQAYG